MSFLGVVIVLFIKMNFLFSDDEDDRDENEKVITFF